MQKKKKKTELVRNDNPSKQPGFLHSVSNCLKSEIGDVSGREGNNSVHWGGVRKHTRIKNLGHIHKIMVVEWNSVV